MRSATWLPFLGDARSAGHRSRRGLAMARRRAASAASAVARALLDLAAARPSRLAAPAARIVPRSLAARTPRVLPARDDDDARPPRRRRVAAGFRPGPVAAHARLVRSGERIGGDARRDAALRHLQRLRDELVAASTTTTRTTRGPPPRLDARQ